MTAPRHVTEGRLVAVAVAVLVAVACSLVAASGDVPGWERAVFHGINGLPDALRPVMWVFQLFGLLFVPLVVAVGALAVRRWRLAIGLAVLVPLKLIVEKLVVKELVERQRPATSICDLDESCGNFRDVPLEGLSFVSGHAVIAWGVVALLWPYVTVRQRLFLVVLALLNAVGRIYLGAHNPLDVVGGGAIGVALGVTITMLIGTVNTARRDSRMSGRGDELSDGLPAGSLQPEGR